MAKGTLAGSDGHEKYPDDRHGNQSNGRKRRACADPRIADGNDQRPEQDKPGVRSKRFSTLIIKAFQGPGQKAHQYEEPEGKVQQPELFGLVPTGFVKRFPGTEHHSGNGEQQSGAGQDARRQKGAAKPDDQQCMEGQCRVQHTRSGL